MNALILSLFAYGGRKDDMVLKLVQQDNITYHGNKLDTETFHILFNRCGFHLCLNQYE